MSFLMLIAIIGGGAFGVWFHIMQQIRKLRAKFPDLPAKEIKNTFLTQEWDVLIVAGMVNALCLFFEYLGASKHIGLDADFAELIVAAFMVVIGYAGNRLVYKALGTSEKVLSKKIGGDNE